MEWAQNTTIRLLINHHIFAWFAENGMA